MELSETEVAMGDKRAHIKLVGEGHGLTVVAGDCLHAGSIAMGPDLAQEVENSEFDTALAALASKRQSALRELELAAPTISRHIQHHNYAGPVPVKNLIGTSEGIA